MLDSSSMTVAKRLSWAFGSIVFVLICVAAISQVTKSRLTEADRWNTHTYKVLNTAAGLLKGMVDMETGARGFLISGDDVFLEPWKTGHDMFERAWDEVKQLTADNPAQQRRLEEMMKLHDEFQRVGESMIELRRRVNQGSESMSTVIAEFSLAKDKAAMDGFRGLFSEFDQVERALLVDRAAQAERTRELNQVAVLGGTAAAILAGILMGLWITRSISRQLGGEPAEAAFVASEIAKGNLSIEISVSDRDQSSLMASMKAMRNSLSSIVSQVRASSESVAAGTQQIASGNTDLSKRTEEQAASLEETASSVEQLTANVRQTAENAQRASQMASGASQAAGRGGDAMGQVVSTMEEITSRSAKIADIINVIDGIAFQTNILALNAAVEAARAGEQGRGFAVVAAEVRNLAKRSADAAKEIKSLIDVSVDRIKLGNDQVAEAGKAMEEIVSQVRQVSTLISEIASAAQEQNNGISQVNQAITIMDQMTQQNAALVEEGAASAGSLAQQAQHLAKTVSVFRISAANYTGSSVAQVQDVVVRGEQRIAMATA